MRQRATVASGIVRGAVGALVAVAILAPAASASPLRVTAARSVRTAPAGSNLLLNPGAEAGAASAQGWDAVTIPGWQVESGLPTVVRYGTAGFPSVGAPGPGRRGHQLFAGGAGGTARLTQVVPTLTPVVSRITARYELSAYLGGSATSEASVTVSFLSASGRRLASRTIGPVGERNRLPHGGLARRAASGLLPAGTTHARVTLALATSLTDWDGPDAPTVGYDRAVADNLSFSLDLPVLSPPVLAPPVAHVPAYQHVFLFYFENEDFGSVIGNTARAPYLNSLLPKGSLLHDFFAEEHPSDANYLALAGGSTFGIPLDDPEEENPLYTIRARNIGDLVDAAHETWKAYLQSAAGPCDDTVHDYYWNDDLPMLYFADVRDRPAYCSAHVVPLRQLQGDLSSTATTPSFSWIGANDCTDMEGCGIASGDKFLRQQMQSILRSPAWLTQRSLVIITFDEDGYDDQNPAQRVATIVLGSSGVRRGYVSHVRYTHYSLLRTIEATLGLGSLTDNDRYAQPLNDVFRASASSQGAARGRAATVPLTAHVPAGASECSPPPPTRGVPSPSRSRPPPTAFVVNSASGNVTPVDLATRKAGAPIAVGPDPVAIAVTPNGATAFVANSSGDTVTPIDVATRRALVPIGVGAAPQAIAILPSGTTAYVADSGSDSVTPIDIATRTAEAPIKVGVQPEAIALSPSGATAYVLDWGGASVTPIDTVTGCAGPSIPVGSYPVAIAFAPDGATAYVACYGSDDVTPIDVATGTASAPMAAGQAPNALAVSPDGRTLEVVDGDTDELRPIDVATGRSSRALRVGYSPVALAVAPSSATAYVVNTISGTVTPVSTATGRAGRPISVGLYSYPTAIALTDGTAVVVDTYSGQVSLVNTRSGVAEPPVTVGSFPVAVAIAG